VSLPLVLLLLLLPLASWSAELTGRVVRVVDGDTVVLLDGSNTQHKIRLAGIDCPERKQPWGTRAKQALSDYVFDQRVTVEWSKLDRYKRVVGKNPGRPAGRGPRTGQRWDVLVVPEICGRAEPGGPQSVRGGGDQGAGGTEGTVGRS
jgi:hypothetical protein